MSTRQYYLKIVKQYERAYKKRTGVDFSDEFRQDLIDFLMWFDDNKIGVWKD